MLAHPSICGNVFFATFKATGALFRPMTPQKTTSPSSRALAFDRSGQSEQRRSLDHYRGRSQRHDLPFAERVLTAHIEGRFCPPLFFQSPCHSPRARSDHPFRAAFCSKRKIRLPPGHRFVHLLSNNHAVRFSSQVQDLQMGSSRPSKDRFTDILKGWGMAQRGGNCSTTRSGNGCSQPAADTTR